MHTPTPTPVPLRADPRMAHLAELLASEVLAANTISVLLSVSKEPTALRVLTRLRGDHLAAADLLRARLGTLPPPHVAVNPLWGPLRAWVPDPALGVRRLLDAERAWVTALEASLASAHLTEEDRELLISALLPAQRGHPPVIEQLLASS